jgi:hypothetical protein
MCSCSSSSGGGSGFCRAKRKVRSETFNRVAESFGKLSLPMVFYLHKLKNTFMEIGFMKDF